VPFATFYNKAFGNLTRFGGSVANKENVITYTSNELSPGRAFLEVGRTQSKNAEIRF